MSVIQAAHRFRPETPLKLVPPRTAERPELDRLVDAFITSRRIQSTGDAYRRDVCGTLPRDPKRALAYLEFLEARNVDFWSASREDVDDWRLYMVSHGLAPQTINKRLAAVTGLYTYAIVDWRGASRLTDNPALRVQRQPGREITQYLGIERRHIERMFTALGERRYSLVDRNRERTTAIVTILALTGIRRGGLVSADCTDLGWYTNEDEGIRRRTMKVRLKRGKIKTMPLPTTAACALDVYLNGRERGPLLLSEDGHRLDGSGVYRSVRRLGDHVLGPEWPGNLHPHDFRHAAATGMLLAGLTVREVQEALAHEEIETTEGYLHAIGSLQESPFDRWEAAVLGKKTNP